jgi:hypothetical protein
LLELGADEKKLGEAMDGNWNYKAGYDFGFSKNDDIIDLWKAKTTRAEGHGKKDRVLTSFEETQARTGVCFVPNTFCYASEYYS